MTNLLDVKIDHELLRAARGKRKRAAVAREVGKTPQHLYNYENNLASPPADVLARLCILYGITIESLTKRTA